jgi:hypothetical protein
VVHDDFFEDPLDMDDIEDYYEEIDAHYHDSHGWLDEIEEEESVDAYKKFVARKERAGDA